MTTRYLHPRLLTIAAIVLSAAAVYGQEVAGDQVAKLIKVPKVELPRAAKDAGVGGKVRALVSVDETGKVTSVKGVFGPDWVCPEVKTPAVTALRASAETSAMLAAFQPATRKGKAVKSEMFVNFDFGASKPLPSSNADMGTRKMTDSDKALIIVEPDPGGEPRIVSGGVVNGAAISLPKPEYPAAARAVRASGAVSIKVLIDFDGLIYSAEPVSGHPLLRSSSRLAACGSKFKPTLLEGRPVKVSGVITYNYVP